jgi:regulator of sirC expression with transglutaminase-like and TPR domain
VLRDYGFRGADDDYYRLDHSRMDHVLRARRGIPITLAVVHLELARSLGLDAVGINFPGHFLVRIGEAMVDPFALQPVSEQAWLDRHAPAARGAPAAALFVVASPRDVLLRMLNNVKGVLVQTGDYARARQIVDCQLRVRRDEPALLIEAAALAQRVGAAQDALASLHAARSALSDPAARARVDEWVARLSEQVKPRLH